MEVAKKILDLVIPAKGISQLNKAELAKLMQSYQLAKNARDDFLKGQLSWEEYLDLLELHQVNIDSYLHNLDHNLHLIGAN